MPDSPTAEEIGRDHRHDLIIELAKRMYPEDGYESEDENTHSSVFQLLCETTDVYTRLVNADRMPLGRPITEQDQAYTLQSVLENVAPSWGMVSPAPLG